MSEHEMFDLMHRMYRETLRGALDDECRDCTHSHAELAAKLADRLVYGPPRPKLRAV